MLVETLHFVFLDIRFRVSAGTYVERRKKGNSDFSCGHVSYILYKLMSTNRTMQLSCGLGKSHIFTMEIHFNKRNSFVWLTIGVLLIGINWTESRLLVRANRPSGVWYPSESRFAKRSNETVLLRDKGPTPATTMDMTPDVTLPSNQISDAVPPRDTDTHSGSLLDLASDVTSPPNSDVVLLTDMTSGIMFESTSATTTLKSSPGVGMYCTSTDDIVVVSNEVTASPRIVDLTNGRVCDRWQGKGVLMVTCGIQTTTPARGVAMLIEYDKENVYSLVSVTCPTRSPRATIDLMVGKNRQQLGKARARMQIGMTYNNISDLNIKCHPTGNVFVTYFPDDSTKHVFAYNSGGNICDALQIRKDIIQIAGCNSRGTIEIAFSSEAITDNIIGGSGMLRMYKFSCSDIGKDPVFFGKVPEVLLLGGTSGLVTWSLLVYASLIYVVVCFMTS